jgi:hypothetical protein
VKELRRQAIELELLLDELSGGGRIGGRIDGSNANVLLEIFERMFFHLRPVWFGGVRQHA